MPEIKEELTKGKPLISMNIDHTIGFVQLTNSDGLNTVSISLDKFKQITKTLEALSKMGFKTIEISVAKDFPLLIKICGDVHLALAPCTNED